MATDTLSSPWKCEFKGCVICYPLGTVAAPKKFNPGDKVRFVGKYVASGPGLFPCNDHGLHVTSKFKTGTLEVVSHGAQVCAQHPDGSRNYIHPDDLEVVKETPEPVKATIERFFIVWSPTATIPPRVRFTKRAQAVAAAEAMAQINGMEFFVMESVGVSKVETVTETVTRKKTISERL